MQQYRVKAELLITYKKVEYYSMRITIPKHISLMFDLDKVDLVGFNNGPVLRIIPIFNEEDFQFALRYYKMVEAFLYEGMINIKFYLSVGNTDTHQEGSIADRVLKDYETLIEKVCNSEMKNVYILPQVHTLYHHRCRTVELCAGRNRMVSADHSAGRQTHGEGGRIQRAHKSLYPCSHRCRCSIFYNKEIHSKEKWKTITISAD